MLQARGVSLLFSSRAGRTCRGHERSQAIIRNWDHDDVIKWKYFPRYWPFVRGIHRSPVNSPHKGQWRGALTFSLIYACSNGWANKRDTGDLRRHRAHHDVIVMFTTDFDVLWSEFLRLFLFSFCRPVDDIQNVDGIASLLCNFNDSNW